MYEKYQLHLNLKEENASMDRIQERLKQQLRFEVHLWDSKHLPIIPGEMTKGKQSFSSKISPTLFSVIYKIKKNACQDGGRTQNNLILEKAQHQYLKKRGKKRHGKEKQTNYK